MSVCPTEQFASSRQTMKCRFRGIHEQHHSLVAHPLSGCEKPPTLPERPGAAQNCYPHFQRPWFLG
jgi:hypothetical protein